MLISVQILWSVQGLGRVEGGQLILSILGNEV